jgi:hypothetical protein
MTTTQAAQQLFGPSLLWFCFLGGLFALAVGVGLVCFSSRTFAVFERMNRWISFRKGFKPMAVPRDSWPFIERHRRWFALAFVVAGACSIANLLMRLQTGKLAALISEKFRVPVAFAEWLTASGWWLLMIGSLLGVATGIALAFFPQAVNRVEQWSSRWVSTRNISRPAEAIYTPLDQLALRHPRVLGGFIVAAALVNLMVVGGRLF